MNRYQTSDAKLRTQVRGEIRELHRRLKTTSVYVTHDQIEAMTMGQMIVVLRDGRIEQAGTPLALYDQPANLFVAGFIGSPEINQLQGEVVLNGNIAALRLKDRFAAGAACGIAGAKRAAGGLRYSPGAGQRGATKRATTRLAAKVTAVENTGSDMQLFCDTGGGAFTSVFKQRLAVKEGDNIWLQPKLSGVHLFDAQSGLRIACAEDE
ncbi:sn-glycerol-3-phosphate import ATP-binding protein UgpC [Raoultella terrigena]|uniref:sn-glycerol-3-phosphate import ATP-binding protein UgpC n=1 Tax=Raoultella terrigena TaxID=577 RepID=A0A3P8IWF2_RAOTE|nr:sn-glycerol-3-phosphate import ATP-binding protein UgpC [Raoultella terrigena]